MKAGRLALLTALMLAGCGRPPEFDPDAVPETYGLQPTSVGGSDVLAAIQLADSLLPKDSPRLGGAWIPIARGAGPLVPVYVVAERNLTPADLAFVTPACEAIVLQSLPFRAWLASLADADGPAVDPTSMTAFVLLHELGHLKRRDCGRRLNSGVRAALNDQTNADKEAEFAADAVAVEIVRSATQFGSPDAKVAAGRVEIALSTASFYIAGRRIAVSPGADLIGAPSVFWDMGLSHPNFEWRLLKVNDLLNSSETSRKFLSDFEAGRDQAKQPLYVAPKP